MVILMSKRQSLDGIINNITTDIRKRTKAALEYAGQKISGDFAVMAYLALDNYYREYEPEFYKRTYQLMNNSYYKVNEFKNYSVNTGIMFDPERMHHIRSGKKEFTEYEIFDNFLDGVHGWKSDGNGGYQQIMFGANYQDQMDKFYREYNTSGLPYHYFQEYMNKH